MRGGDKNKRGGNGRNAANALASGALSAGGGLTVGEKFEERPQSGKRKDGKTQIGQLQPKDFQGVRLKIRLSQSLGTGEEKQRVGGSFKKWFISET